MNIRVFVINYVGGFALISGDIAQINYIVERKTDVLVREALRLEQAYVLGAEYYVYRERLMYPNKVVVPPKFEDMIDNPIFQERGLQSNLVSLRVFSGICEAEAAILTSASNVAAFMEEHYFGYVKEFPSVLEAQQHIKHHFENKIMAMGAYFNNPIPTYNNFPTDTVIEMEYRKWLMDNINQIPEAIRTEFMNRPNRGYQIDEGQSLQLDIGRYVEGYQEGNKEDDSK